MKFKKGDCGMETNISSDFDRNEIKRCYLIAKDDLNNLK
jgi:hypothetical protein